jgi:uncharacterized membrane protein
MHGLRIYASTLATLIVVDGMWLAVVAIPLFKSELGALLRVDANLAAAAAFYVIYSAGVTLLAVVPSVRETSPRSALWRGAVLGLTAYAAFDLTNLAIIQGWTLRASLVDMCWGTLLTAVAAAVGYLAGRVRANA